MGQNPNFYRKFVLEAPLIINSIQLPVNYEVHWLDENPEVSFSEMAPVSPCALQCTPAQHLEYFFRLSLRQAPVSKESFQTSTMYMVNVTQWSLCVFVYLCLCPFVCSTHVSRHRTSKEDFMKKKKGGRHYCMSALAIKAQTCDFFLEIVKIRSKTLLRHKQQTEHFQQAAKTNPTQLHPFKF